MHAITHIISIYMHMYMYIYIHMYVHVYTCTYVHGRDVNTNNVSMMYYTAVLIVFRILLKDGHIRIILYVHVLHYS